MLLVSAHTSFGPDPDSVQSLIVIGNPQGTPSEITFEELVKVMKGHKPRWNDGTKVKIALMKPKTSVGMVTAKIIYGMSPTELSKYWLTMVFEGRSSPPEFFSDEADLIKYVLKTEGAIGITSQSSNGSKIITVSGMPEI
jgi:hypothetical protein